MSRYETGYLRPSWPAVQAMLQMCEGTHDDRARALELWEYAPAVYVEHSAGGV